MVARRPSASSTFADGAPDALGGGGHGDIGAADEGNRMMRRDFISAICGVALLAPRDAAAEQAGKVWQLGSVFSTTPERGAYLAQALEQELGDLGYVQSRNIVLTNRFAEPQPDKL